MEQRFQQNASVETAPLQQEVILFHPGLNRFCMLNHTSSFIWRRLQSPVSPEEIAADISSHFDGVAAAQALDDVKEALAEFQSQDLVLSVPEPVS